MCRLRANQILSVLPCRLHLWQSTAFSAPFPGKHKELNCPFCLRTDISKSCNFPISIKLSWWEASWVPHSTLEHDPAWTGSLLAHQIFNGFNCAFNNEWQCDAPIPATGEDLDPIACPVSVPGGQGPLLDDWELCKRGLPILMAFAFWGV